MKSTGWKDLAELIGIAAIVGSLLFVGLQMRQSQEIAIAAQYQARAEATMDMYLTHLETGFALRTFREHLGDDFSAQDAAMIAWAWTAFDNHHFQYQSGFLTEDTWQGLLRAAKGVHQHCRARFIFEARKHSMRSEFVAMVESWEDRC